jgi:nicotinate-nucleotide adenylyltransferase
MNVPLKNVALYGGSFDPLHLGHLAVARAAAEKFALDRVYFVPAGAQPLKTQQHVTSFEHRYAMLRLALAGEEKFVLSGLESPATLQAAGVAAGYTIDTVARLRQQLAPDTRLFLLMGVDAFQHIAKWRAAVELLQSVEFIVASRPGFALADIAQALPSELHPKADAVNEMLRAGCLQSGAVRIHLLPDVNQDVSATAIRRAAQLGQGLEDLVPRAVADYIVRFGIYGGPSRPEPGQ